MSIPLTPAIRTSHLAAALWRLARGPSVATIHRAFWLAKCQRTSPAAAGDPLSCRRYSTIVRDRTAGGVITASVLEEVDESVVLGPVTIGKQPDGEPVLEANVESHKHNGRVVKIPSVWLRDHCQCSKCIHPQTKQRQVDIFHVSDKIERCDLSQDSAYITWADGHESRFDLSWIQQKYNTYKDRDARVARSRFARWAKPYEQRQRTHLDYQRVMTSEQGLAELMTSIRLQGYCFLTGCPPTPEATQAALERIGPIRNTHYGAFWDFTSNMASKDTAYTSDGLDVHTDTNYFSDPAGLQMFHLLSHDGEGGENQLVDGFRAAEILRQDHPKEFKVLRSNAIWYHSSGNEGLSIQPAHPAAVIRCDSAGTCEQIRWNNFDRAGFASPPSQAWYDAARVFNEILHRDHYTIRQEFRLQPGTPLIFDNWRVLHGRSGFSGARRMCGGYINRDDYVSRYKTSTLGYENVLQTGIY